MNYPYTPLRGSKSSRSHNHLIASLAGLFLIGAGLSVFHREAIADKLYGDADYHSTSSPSSSSPSWTSHKEPLDGVCTLEQIANLDWIQTSVSTSEAVVALNGFHPIAGTTFCAAIEARPPPEDPRYLTWETERVVEVGKWIREAAPCRVYEPETRAMMKRLLRSKAGLFLVGDSLTRYQFDMLEAYFVYPGGPIYRRSLHTDFAVLNFNQDHPITKELLLEAGVHKSRLHRPLVTMLQTWSFAELPELLKIFGSNYKYQQNGDLKVWYNQFLESLGYAEMAEMDEGQKVEQNIVQVNTGAHWGGENAIHLTLEQMSSSYKDLTEVMVDKLRMLDTESPLQIIWRAISPGHVDCETLTSPNNTMTSGQHPERPDKQHWNWAHFPSWNQIAQDTIQASARSNKAYLQAPVQYMDIWPMSVKRPDAHRTPGADCLHWCNYNLMYEWKRLLWHMIIVDSKYDDYY